MNRLNLANQPSERVRLTLLVEMAIMAAKGIHLLNGQQPRLRQIIFELRYSNGYMYLDRCGRILNRLIKELPEWMVGNDVSPQNAPLYSVANGCRLSFSSIKIDLDLQRTADEEEIEVQDIYDFSSQVDNVTSTIVDELGLRDFTRIGFRSLFHIPFETKEAAEGWLVGLGFFSTSPNLVKAFGGTQHSVGFASTFSGSDARYRVSLTTVEKPAQFDGGTDIVSVRASALPSGQKDHLKKLLKVRQRMRTDAGYAVVIDIDSYLEDPRSIDPRDFITRNASDLMDRIRQSLTNQ